jgi:hypothetical protein
MIKVAIAYLGSYNHFDYTYQFHKEQLFDTLDNLNIEYHIYANLSNTFYIHCCGGPNGPKIEKKFIEEFALNNVNLKKHIPLNWNNNIEKCYEQYIDFQLDNIMKNDKNYSLNRFKNIFKDKIKNIEIINSFPNKTQTNHAREWFDISMIYHRHKLITENIRFFEKNNNIKYDILISMRPDILFYDNTIKNNIKNIINDCINNNNPNFFYISNNTRPDFFIISKKNISEILNKKIFLKHYDKKKHIPKNCDFPIIELFIKYYFNPKILNIEKFDHWWCDKILLQK